MALVEYGDYECVHCGRAEPIIRDLLAEFSDDLRSVFRHLPLTDVHPQSQLAAEAAEAAAAQGKFRPMHDWLFAHQNTLEVSGILRHDRQIELDIERISADLHYRTHATRITIDADSAAASGVAGTPTFFISGRRHHGRYDIDSLQRAVLAARQDVH